MVVVVIIGVLAVAAAPSMRLTTYERHAYNDAGAIMQLFRDAHARAVAYSVPVVVSMSANTTGDRGTFGTYIANSPVSAGSVVSCKGFAWTPLTTANAAITEIDWVNLNGPAGSAEADASIQTALWYYTTSAGTQFNNVSVCFTPLGHSYITTGAAPAPPTPLFGAAMLPNISPLVALVTRGTGALNRSVVLLPNGSARVFSHLW
jgi:hypothetical protein